MKNALLFSFLSLGIFLMGCKSDTPLDQSDEYKDIMKVHDDAMEKMSEINELGQQLVQYAEGQADSTMAAMAHELRMKLESAEDGMMNWMQGWKLPEKPSKEEAMEFFAKQKEQVNSVSMDINKSIEEAKNFLQKSKNE
ncbi:MAG TPA: hypothetical protein PKC30_04945 [Saprospiraceae bacterium]|nr:hypothetical protein [Saprospiraceae bacterium]